jgi:hypothetical protein
MLAQTDMKPFGPQDYQSFSGVDSEQPLIGENDTHLLILDGDTLMLSRIGSDTNMVNFNLTARVVEFL